MRLNKQDEYEYVNTYLKSVFANTHLAHNCVCLSRMGLIDTPIGTKWRSRSAFRYRRRSV